MNDWWHFIHNSPRVRRLIFPHYGGKYGLTSSALLEIASTRTIPVIFPNLLELSAGSYEFDVMFTAPFAHAFDLFLNTQQQSSARMPIPTLLRHIPERMPHLSELFIESDAMVHGYDNEFAGALAFLLNLRIVTLPLYSFSPAVCMALSGLPQVQYIMRNHQEPKPQRGDEIAQKTFPNLALHPNAFPSLIYIALSSHCIVDARRVLLNPHFPTFRLATLKLHIPFSLDPVDVRGFLDSLAETASSSLRKLVLEFVKADYRLKEEVAKITPLRFEHILPATRFKHLFQLTITHTYPIELTDNDVKQLLEPWTNIEHLFLNPHPVITTAPSLTLAALKHLAKNCRTLNSVGLYVDASRPIPSIECIAPLRTWKQFWIGCSPLPPKSAMSSTYPPIVKFCAQLLHDDVEWKWKGDWETDQAEEIRSKVTGSWLFGVRGYVDVEKMEKGWRIIEMMTRMMLEERRR